MGKELKVKLGSQEIEIINLVFQGIGVCFWPACAVVFVWNFRIQIVRDVVTILDTIPSIITGLKTFKIANVGEFNIDKTTIDIGNPEHLSLGAIKQLINLCPCQNVNFLIMRHNQKKREYGVPNQEVLVSLKELEKKGFLCFRNPLESFMFDLNKLERSEAHRSDSERIWYRSPFSADSEEDKRFLDQAYFLTEKGRKEWNWIFTNENSSSISHKSFWSVPRYYP